MFLHLMSWVMLTAAGLTLAWVLVVRLAWRRGKSLEEP